MPLTQIEIRNAKPGMHADGGGLYLSVKSSGAKSWLYRYQIAGRRREMGLGALTVLPPVEARAEAARLKATVRQGTDPLEVKAEEQRERQIAAQIEQVGQKLQAATFRRVAEDHIAMQEAGWKNSKHRQQWENTLKTYVYPVVGDMPVGEINAEHVLQILKPIWNNKTETATRVRMRIEAILDAAKVKGLRQGENPARWRGNLDAVLPAKSKVHKVKHHDAMDWKLVPSFWRSLVDQPGMGALALRLTILTALRSGEVRKATWDEFDLDEAIWTIPAEKMKADREHRVPLSPPALELLRSLPRMVQTDLVFPGVRVTSPLSDMTLSAVLRRMGIDDVTVHGFRSSFRDWAAEETHHDGDTVELALAHVVKNQVERAYRRGDQLAKRRALMDDWAKWLSGC
ncbi:tyrosine-type recombinase/integrase [Novosphingobium soli]|uniref:Tyrosine-type recombinase/integrase n=1 Tax=Novosphingobium soli TaxID=574956 RepID=A0ABV6CZP2_9SPHN